MGPTVARELWDLYKGLLDKGEVTVNQEDDIIGILETAWEAGNDAGLEDVDDERSVSWGDGYAEGLVEGEANA